MKFLTLPSRFFARRSLPALSDARAVARNWPPSFTVGARPWRVVQVRDEVAAVSRGSKAQPGRLLRSAGFKHFHVGDMVPDRGGTQDASEGYEEKSQSARPFLTTEAMARRSGLDDDTGRRLEHTGLTEGMTQMRLIKMWVAHRHPGYSCVDVHNVSRMRRPPPTRPKACTPLHRTR